MHFEVQSIEAHIKDKSEAQLTCIDPEVGMLTERLKDTIRSLEKQLDEKQKIIEKFMERPIIELAKKQSKEVYVNSPMTSVVTLEACERGKYNCPSYEKAEQKSPKPQGKKFDNVNE